MVTTAIIDDMVQRIVEKFDPLRVILFGSCARKEITTHSDVDLLVVMPDGTDPCQAAIAMMSELRNADAAKDVVVATPDILREFGGSVGMVYRKSPTRGRGAL